MTKDNINNLINVFISDVLKPLANINNPALLKNYLSEVGAMLAPLNNLLEVSLFVKNIKKEDYNKFKEMLKNELPKVKGLEKEMETNWNWV